MRTAKKFFEEIWIVFRLLRGWELFNWSRALFTRLATVLSQRSLGPVDQRIGSEFSFQAAGRQISIQSGSFGVVREIFGRNAYITPAELARCRTVVDLGANCGVFSLFALIHAPAAHVYAIDAQPEQLAALRANIASNGFAGRITAEVGMIGSACDEWGREFLRSHPEVGTCDLDSFMKKVGPCDFLKCDIEGGEFHIVNEQMHWMDKVNRFSLEYHGTPADGEMLAVILRRKGFGVVRRDHGTLGYLDGIRQ